MSKRCDAVLSRCLICLFHQDSLNKLCMFWQLKNWLSVRKIGSRVTPTFSWSRTENHISQGLGTGLSWPIRPTKTVRPPCLKTQASEPSSLPNPVVHHCCCVWGSHYRKSRDVYSDTMMWLYGSSPARGKANRFLEDSKPALAPAQNYHLIHIGRKGVWENLSWNLYY